MINLNDPQFTPAKRRGYILPFDLLDPAAFELTLVGQWLIKNPKRIKELDVMTKVFGHMPTWEDMTDRNLKELKQEVLGYLCKNSANKFFSRLVAILNDMRNEVDIPCNRYAEILKTNKEPSQSVFLSEVEISKLEQIVPANKEEQYVKCLYLMECYCGARHSDIMELDNNNIVSVSADRRYVSYVSKKSRIEANIPLHRNFESCLNGYDRSIEMLDCTFNDILRDMCRRAGITQHTKLFRRGKWEEGEKYKFITSHIARKSFCSDLYLRGVDARTISKMAGHSSSLTTEKTYIIPMRELSDKAMDFFN